MGFEGLAPSHALTAESATCPQAALCRASVPRVFNYGSVSRRATARPSTLDRVALGRWTSTHEPNFPAVYYCTQSLQCDL